eukprot:5984599-Prymnesium_polylepis.1
METAHVCAARFHTPCSASGILLVLVSCLTQPCRLMATKMTPRDRIIQLVGAICGGSPLEEEEETK